MCLIVFAFKHHSKYPFILAGNRDEFYARDARQAHFWDTDPEMLAGKDLRAGGTWLGVSKKGEYGAITNYRDFNNPKEGERSRGEIIPNLLTDMSSPEVKLRELMQESHHYSGFNLLTGDSKHLFYSNNINGDREEVEPGIHGLSNAFLDTSWPKVETAKKEFTRAISSDEIDRDLIFGFLQNSETYPQESLPNTGLDPDMEKAVSSIFIETDGYGTRCSTLLMIDNSGTVHFIEKTYPVSAERAELIKEYTFDTLS
jgi:uncharacterized protein with NRDE domain